MSEANIVVGLDLRNALVDAKTAGPKIAQALNLQGDIDRGLTRPSGNARMALMSLTQAVQDASVVNLDFGSIMRATANNIDFGAQALSNLAVEAKRKGSSMGRELLNAIKGPSGILIGVSLLIGALSLLPRLFESTGIAAERAAEGGMKKYSERLVELGSNDIVEINKRAEEMKKRLQEQQRQLYTFVTPAGGGMPTKVFNSKEAEAAFNALQKQIDILNGFLGKNKETIDQANELNAILGIAGGVLGIRPFERQRIEAQIAAMKEGIEKEKAIADQKLKDDIVRAEKEIQNEKARSSIIQDLRKAHAQRLKEIEKPLRDVEVLQSNLPLSEQFRRLGMSGEDLQRVMKFDRSGFDNQLAELEKMRGIAASSDLAGDKKFSVIKDIENEIERVKQRRMEAEAELRELKIQAIEDEEAREIASIEEKYRQKADAVNRELADGQLKADTLAAYEAAKQTEIDAKRKEFEERRRRDEEKIAKELSDIAIYRTAGELQVRLNAIHREYQERKEKVEELRKLNQISAEEEIDLLQNLTKAENRDRERAAKQYHETVRNEWRETHQVGMLSINSLNAGIRQMWGTFILGNRQAKDEWDAVWLSIRNTALGTLGDIITKYIENEIIARAISAGSTAAVASEMTAISVAAAPAALATNIATMGAAGVAASATFASASASLSTAMSSLKILAAAEGARINRPTLTMIGEAGEPELVAPEKDFYSIAREELVPNVLSLIAREGINIGNYRVGGGESYAGVTRASMRGVEKLLRGVQKSIDNLNLSVDLDDGKLLWIVKNREKIEKILSFKG